MPTHIGEGKLPYRVHRFKCYFYLDRRRQWHPTPVLLPGKSHGQRSLVGCSPWGQPTNNVEPHILVPFDPITLINCHSSFLPLHHPLAKQLSLFVDSPILSFHIRNHTIWLWLSFMQLPPTTRDKSQGIHSWEDKSALNLTAEQAASDFSLCNGRHHGPRGPQAPHLLAGDASTWHCESEGATRERVFAAFIWTEK